MRPEVVWITGASAGIGRAVAERFYKAGATVIATARGEDKLEAMRSGLGERLIPAAGDISDGVAITDLVAKVEAEHGPIDRAILNAGTHKPVDAKDFKADDLKALIDINLIGTARCLEPVMQRMIERKSGQIAVVSSVAGYTGLPTSAYYGASKAGLINMTESLKFDLDRSSVDLRLIDPGFVRTPLTDLNDFPMPFLMEPEDAAERIYHGLVNRKSFEITFPRRFSYILKVLRMLPYPLYFPIVGRSVAR